MAKAWWNNATNERPLYCVYCGTSTSETEDLEHILPESLGNKATLYPGAVCKKCNNSLGSNVDSKIFNEPMTASGHVAQETPGKKGVRTKIGPHVEKTQGGVTVTGGISGSDHEFAMSRAIAKCGVNIYTHWFGSLKVRDEFPEIIKFVREPKSRNDIWPYAVALTPVGGFALSFGTESFEIDGTAYPMSICLSASGLFVSPMYRDTPNAALVAHDFVLDRLKDAKDAGHQLVSMTYYTKK